MRSNFFKGGKGSFERVLVLVEASARRRQTGDTRRKGKADNGSPFFFLFLFSFLSLLESQRVKPPAKTTTTADVKRQRRVFFFDGGMADPFSQRIINETMIDD